MFNSGNEMPGRQHMRITRIVAAAIFAITAVACIGAHRTHANTTVAAAGPSGDPIPLCPAKKCAF
jgi:hypothetical protein